MDLRKELYYRWLNVTKYVVWIYIEEQQSFTIKKIKIFYFHLHPKLNSLARPSLHIDFSLELMRIK